MVVKNREGKDRSDDYKRFNGIDREYDFKDGKVGNAVPQSEKSTKA